MLSVNPQLKKSFEKIDLSKYNFNNEAGINQFFNDLNNQTTNSSLQEELVVAAVVAVVAVVAAVTVVVAVSWVGGAQVAVVALAWTKVIGPEKTSIANREIINKDEATIRVAFFFCPYFRE